MCGILGIVSNQGVEREIIEAMTSSLAHRGPDHQNCFQTTDGFFALGHTRLSIIDLSDAANQPFHSTDGRYVIVFNGEIYNYKALRKQLTAQHNVSFRTSSDTEVLVEGFSVWGTSMVSKLEGMFAFAILDRRTGRLFLFRDRVGKKPLFYAESDAHFVFASEIKSLLCHPVVAASARVRKQSLQSFLHLGYIPEPHTIYDTIFKFPAGHFGELTQGGRLQLTTYWRLEEHITNARIVDTVQAKERLLNLLDIAVQDRLVSDVPVGAFLSGGTDSSLVSAIASKHISGRLKTFSIGFKESKFDESAYAREVSRHLGTEHQEFILEERDAIDILQEYLRHFDEPFADTSAIPTMLVSKLARRDVKVALTGDGGDELFLGYGSYTWANRLDSPLMRMFRAPVEAILSRSGKSRTLRAGHLLESVSQPQLRSHIFSQEQYFFSQSELEKLLSPMIGKLDNFTYSDPSIAPQLIPSERQALFDFEYYLKDDLLVKVDRASMYYALECRCPLLDHRIVEFAFNLSPKLKVRDGIAKWILKELLLDYLPEDLIHRKKWGFSVPLARWMKGELKYFIDENLNEHALADVGIFNIEYVNNLMKNFLAGRDYLYNRLWVIAVLQNWMKKNAANISA